MRATYFSKFTLLLAMLACGVWPAAARSVQPLRGTLVVAVPVREGLVACADKRLFNSDAGTFTDDNIKIRKVDDRTLFVATNTVGFYDQRTRTIAFDAFETTSKYTAANKFAPEKSFWNGLKKEITGRLRSYLSNRPFAEWPESDRANNNLLFNLIFYTVRDDRAYGYSMRVFYEKAKTPIITIPDPIREQVLTPKLSGKGREVMTYLARNPSAAADPLIQRFDETRFNAQATTAKDATDFAAKLFQLTSANIAQANVSPTFDCAMLDYSTGFQSIK